MKSKVSHFASRLRSKIGLIGAGALAATASAARAEAIDMSALTTGVQDQISESFTTVAPIVGVILALGVGMKLIKRWMN